MIRCKKIAIKSLKNSEKGFTLVEILVVLTLLSIMGTLVFNKVFQSYTEANIKATETKINGLADRLKEYRLKCHSYPTSLQALLTKPAADGGKECKNYPPGGFIDGDELPQDTWDEEFYYESDGKKFDIWSYGPDREEGGEGLDADIHYRKEKSE